MGEKEVEVPEKFRLRVILRMRDSLYLSQDLLRTALVSFGPDRIAVNVYAR